MFIAIGILILGILAGRLTRSFWSAGLLSRLTMSSIFLLLFLLGTAIGSNRKLLASLPNLGLQSLVIMLCCVAGSILLSILITPFLNNAHGKRDKTDTDG